MIRLTLRTRVGLARGIWSYRSTSRNGKLIFTISHRNFSDEYDRIPYGQDRRRYKTGNLSLSSDMPAIIVLQILITENKVGK